MDEEKPFNKLTPAELERLAYLVGELGEAVQAIGNILRHGYESKDPSYPESPTNRELLEIELGDVQNGVNMLAEVGEIDQRTVNARALYKREACMQYMHHQATSVL